jgi:hypothetical protein
MLHFPAPQGLGLFSLSLALSLKRSDDAKEKHFFLVVIIVFLVLLASLRAAYPLKLLFFISLYSKFWLLWGGVGGTCLLCGGGIFQKVLCEG